MSRDAAPLSVSPYVAVRWRDGRIYLSCAQTDCTFAPEDVDVLRVLHAFSSPTTAEAALVSLKAKPGDGLAECIRALQVGQFLQPARADIEPAEQIDAAPWEPAALAFHRESRAAGFRKRDREIIVPRAPARSSKAIKLAHDANPRATTLPALLEQRASRRTWTRSPIPFATYSQLFGLAARARPPRDTRVGPSHVYPSAGGCYSLVLYAVVAGDAVEGVPAGIYRYAPNAHALDCLSEQPEDCQAFIDAAGASAASAPPPTTLVMTSRFAFPASAYGSLAYSLVLKEVGCLMQTLYLVGEYLELAVCALGAGSPSGHFARVTRTGELAEPIVGEMMIGLR